jgi:hypothetical protein
LAPPTSSPNCAINPSKALAPSSSAAKTISALYFMGLNRLTSPPIAPPNKRKIKRQLQYQKTWDEKGFKPFTLIELDDKGKVLYDKAVEDKKKPADRKPDPNKDF